MTADLKTDRYQTLLMLPADVGASLHGHVAGGQVAHELGAGPELPRLAELAVELGVLLVADSHAAAAPGSRPQPGHLPHAPGSSVSRGMVTLDTGSGYYTAKVLGEIRWSLCC